MEKTYYDYLNEITDEDLLYGLFNYGFFAREFPKVFTTKSFYEYAIDKNRNGFKELEYKHARPMYHEINRNVNSTRTINLPDPFLYYNLSVLLSENYQQLLKFFKEKTKDDKNKVSINHFTKPTGSPGSNEFDLFFSPTYDAIEIREEEDDLNELKIRRGISDTIFENHFFIKTSKKFKVEADISNYFRSVYTHSIPWAILGKEETRSKMFTNDFKKSYYNKIDIGLRSLNENQTTGVLVGIYSSHLISEILLVSVDNELRSEKWDYYRYTDDYVAYVDSEKDANDFLIALRKSLKKYNLFLNPKKTRISKLPSNELSAIEELKKTAIYRSIIERNKEQEVDKRLIEMFILELKNLLDKYDNASIINYGFKFLSGYKLSNESVIIILFESIHLTLLYPYLIRFLEEFVIDFYYDYDFKSELYKPYVKKSKEIFKKTFSVMYNDALDYNNYEVIIYLIKINQKVDIGLEIVHSKLIETNNPFVMLLGYIYAKFIEDEKSMLDYKEKARKLSRNSDGDFDSSLESFQENWLFIYEVLDKQDLNGQWLKLKNNGVSFINEGTNDN